MELIAERPEWIPKEYIIIGKLPDDRYCGILRLLYHWTIHINIDISGYEDRYCYHSLARAMEAIALWDGKGEPDGWNKHPRTGRCRDPETGEEWLESEPRPVRA